MTELPRGTVTLLFTDIEGSTRMLQELGREEYVRALTEHRRLLRAAFTAHGGVEVEMQGDSFHFAFPYARDAVTAAAAGQRGLREHGWTSEPIRVRVGLHTGEPMQADGLYAGLDVHRAARVMSAGHGGQVLLSERTADLVEAELPDGVTLLDLGERRLKDLAKPEKLYQLVVEGLQAEFPPLKTLESRQTNLPVVSTPLVGREAELASVKRLLSQDGLRLLTLTGTGGTGKTRLALHAVAELIDSFEGGVFFVALAPVRDPALVISAIAQALGVREQAGTPLPETLTSFLRDREVLLLLDNFEHVLEAGVEVARLLAASARLKVVVTSRTRLNVSGEHDYPVPALGLPDPSCLVLEELGRSEAVRLFVERAVAVKPDFALTAPHASAVAAICVRLDGLPLALELAAARLKVLSPDALLRRLDHSLGLLTGGAVDADERHRTLNATIEWSYDLLSDAEKKLFARLAVFTGGARLDTAEAVCDPAHDLGIEVFDGLASLVEKNLVRQRDDPDGEPRFWSLETIREYAADRLAESDEATLAPARHAAFFLALAESAVDASGDAEASSHEALHRDESNLRAALEWLHGAEDGERLARLVAALTRYWDLENSPAEAATWIDEALARTEGPTLIRERLLTAATWTALDRGQLAAARDLAKERLNLARALGESELSARATNTLGEVHRRAGDLIGAREFVEESVALARPHGGLGLAGALGNHGALLEQLGELDAAERVWQESLGIARGLDNRHAVGSNLCDLGGLALDRGAIDDAETLLLEGLQLSREIGHVAMQAACLRALGEIFLTRGSSARAVRLVAAAAALRGPDGAIEFGIEQLRTERTLAQARAAVDEESFARLWREGEQLGSQAAIAYALSECTLAEAQLSSS